MTAWRTRLVRVDGQGLHVHRAGPAGARPVVALHGIGDDGRCWEGVAEELARDHDVVLIDARGHGRSDAPAQGYATTDHVADVVGVITALELRRPVLLGHSMGAVTALVLAGLHPGLPARVVVEDPPGWWARAGWSEADQLAATQRLARTIVALQRRTHQELLAIQGEAAPNWSPLALQRWAEATQRLAPQVAGCLVAQHRSNRTLDWPALLTAVRCPVLLLHGEPARGGALGREEVAALASQLPRLEAVELAGGGHALRHECPEAYLAAVGAFLRRHR